ncbi:agmatine deiminase [Trifolium repens]|nr:agmatine deiminase [Trifolium repens]
MLQFIQFHNVLGAADGRSGNDKANSGCRGAACASGDSVDGRSANEFDFTFQKVNSDNMCCFVRPAAGVFQDDEAKPILPGTRLAASYVNF